MSLALMVSELTKKSYVYPLSLVYFMLLIVKSFEIFFKQNGYNFILESFVLA